MTSLPFTRNWVLKGPEISKACAIFLVAILTLRVGEKKTDGQRMHHVSNNTGSRQQTLNSSLGDGKCLFGDTVQLCSTACQQPTFSSAPWLIVWVGSMRVASPECTPASSTCSVMAWTRTWTEGKPDNKLGWLHTFRELKTETPPSGWRHSLSSLAVDYNLRDTKMVKNSGFKICKVIRLCCFLESIWTVY